MRGRAWLEGFRRCHECGIPRWVCRRGGTCHPGTTPQGPATSVGGVKAGGGDQAPILARNQLSTHTQRVETSRQLMRIEPEIGQPRSPAGAAPCPTAGCHPQTRRSAGRGAKGEEPSGRQTAERHEMGHAHFSSYKATSLRGRSVGRAIPSGPDSCAVSSPQPRPRTQYRSSGHQQTISCPAQEICCGY